MSTWYEKNIGTIKNAFGYANQIQQAFLARYVAPGRVSGAAVFLKYSGEMDSVTAYFTPDTFALAHELGAAPCDEPPKHGTTLLVGERSVNANDS